jgi:tetratricopeptide (TPR) repeat protein
MTNEISLITQQLFHKANIDEVSIEELESFVNTFPYVSVARYLLAKKRRDADPAKTHRDILTAKLYFHNPLWFQWQLNLDLRENNSAVMEPLPVTPEVQKPETAQAPEKQQPAEEEIAFQSYHTIDYFASQGIRLQQADLSKDRLGQQLKSFTEWLRSMKKLPMADTETARTAEDDSRQQVVIKDAAVSIEEKEIVTETMAEVWAKQGNHEKAIEIYNKLSLLNPAKSAYFAAKIDQLK